MRKILQFAFLLGLANTVHAQTFTHLHFTGLPQTVIVGQCAKFSINTTDDAGVIAAVAADTFVYIGGAMGFDHFSDAACKIKASGFTITAGQSSGTFYISTAPCPPKQPDCSLPHGRSSVKVLSGTKSAMQIITVE